MRDLPQGATDDFIRNSWFGQEGWRWMFGFTAVPAALFFLSMFFIPESPRWLAKNGSRDAAYAVLKRVSGDDYARTAIADIESTLGREEINQVHFADLFDPRWAVVLTGRHSRHLSTGGAASTSSSITPRKFSAPPVMTSPRSSRTSPGQVP